MAESTRAVLVGGVKDSETMPDTVEAQAAFIRNRRRALAAEAEAVSRDFILVGQAEGGQQALSRALLPNNPRRALLEPVVLTSYHRRQCEYTDFVLLGPVKDLPLAATSAEAQAAWLRNHRKSLRDIEVVEATGPTSTSTSASSGTAAIGEGDTPPSSPASTKAARVDTPIPGRRASRVKQQREERTSSNSVIAELA